MTAKDFGWKVTGKSIKCDKCGIAKAKQKSVPKVKVKRCNQKGKRLLLDVSSIKHQSLGGSKFWLLIIDDATDYCWSYFMKKKNETSQMVRFLIKHLKATKKTTI